MESTASNSAKALQQNRQRPAVPKQKQIVPAIPLSFVQRRQKSQPAPAKPKEEIAVSPPPVVDEPSPSPTIQPEVAVVNGSTQSENLEDTNESASTSAPETPATEEETTESAVAQSEASVHESLGMQMGPSVSTPHGNLTDYWKDEPQESSRSAPSDTMTSESRSTYHMPAPFISANPDLVPTMSSEAVKFPPQPNFNGQSPMRHAHPNTGSVLFGGYPESNNSSPAPPSAGNVPPYPFPNQQQARVVVGRHGAHQSNGGHSHHMSNGYSPMGPPPGYYTHPEGNMNPGADSYARRQMVSFAPPDGYSPSSTPLGMEGQRLNGHDFPSTPHSFHGSQSSAPSEQDNGPAFYGQYPTAVISNGSNGHIDDVRLYQPSRQVHGSAQNNLPPQLPAQPPMPIDNLDGLVNYVQRQFAMSEFTDYTVELRYADDRSPPDYIPGHGLMFARSPTLKTLMTTLARENHGGRTLLIESDDRFVRPDAFWMALHRLYGGPLLDIDALGPINAPPHNQLSIPMPGTPADRFELALRYAAAGHILQIPPVVTRGVEIACTLVQWVTLEKALDFALDGGLDAQWTLESSHQQAETPSTYGPAVNMLIRYALEFIVTSFPPNFELGGTVDEPFRNRRLPAVPEDRPNAQNARLSRIKFGDHPTQESIKSTNTNPMIVTLSKVLLNLPFHLLKYVLESRRLGNVDQWATGPLRQKVMDSVVQERENRRVKVYNNIQVSNADRQKNYAAWQAVGWQEYVELQGGKEGIPILARKWVDYVLPAHQN
jgi:hypothetical protein